MYIRHILIAWAQFLLSHHQTTSHVVLVQPRGDRKIAKMEQGPHGTGPSRGNQHVKKIVWDPKWSRSSPSVIVLESEDGNKGTLHQKREYGKGERVWLIDVYSHDTSWNFSDNRFAIFITIYLHISGYSSVRGIFCACVFLVLIVKASQVTESLASHSSISHRMRQYLALEITIL